MRMFQLQNLGYGQSDVLYKSQGTQVSVLSECTHILYYIYYIILYYIILYYIILYYIILYYTALCYVTRVMLYYIMLCYIILYIIHTIYNIISIYI